MEDPIRRSTCASWYHDLWIVDHQGVPIATLVVLKYVELNAEPIPGITSLACVS